MLEIDGRRFGGEVRYRESCVTASGQCQLALRLHIKTLEDLELVWNSLIDYAPPRAPAVRDPWILWAVQPGSNFHLISPEERVALSLMDQLPEKIEFLPFDLDFVRPTPGHHERIVHTRGVVLKGDPRRLSRINVRIDRVPY